MFILQRGEDRLHGDGYHKRFINVLPSDVPTLAKGDWQYSEELKGWIGHALSEEEDKRIYEARIGKA